MSLSVTSDMAHNAIDLVEPMRLQAAQIGLLKRSDGHVIVADGRGPYKAGGPPVIFEKSFGDREQWVGDYKSHCSSKADICWRTGTSSREAIHLTPWLLEEGDSTWEGGIIIDRIIVAYSGADAEYDEAIAYGVMGWVRGFAFFQAVSTGLWTPNRPGFVR